MSLKKGLLIFFIILIIYSLIQAVIQINNKTTLSNSNASIKNSITDISDFDYSIEGENLVIEKYNGRQESIIINDTYTIDSKEYKVTNIEHAVFNGCDANLIYLPKTLVCIYDDTLAYLDNEVIDIYYEGTEEEWNKIFTKYETSSVSEEWNSGNAEGAGEALASKINSKIGHQYDKNKFNYHYEANIDDITN